MKWSEVCLTVKKENEINHQICASLTIPDDLSPYAVYTILKGKLGEPNSDFDPTRSEWAYELKVRNVTIEIYDWKLGWWRANVCVESGNKEEAERIGLEFLELLHKEAERYNKQIKTAAEGTDSFILQNPFALYYRSANNIIEEIENITLKSLNNSVTFLEKPLELEDICRSAFFLFIASFEGLLNLIYELYLKPELRDERIYDRLSREQIDIKVRLAPVYCNCFSSDLINSESESFKKFHSIVNLRNDFIHANLTKAMKIPIIIDNNRRLMHFPITRDKLGLPKSISELKIQDIQFVKESIDEMVNILLQDMKPRYKREFREVMDKNFILVETEDSEIVIVGGDDYIG